MFPAQIPQHTVWRRADDKRYTSTYIIYIAISLLMCYDRVRPPDDSTDEGSVCWPQRSVQSSGLEPEAMFLVGGRQQWRAVVKPSARTESDKTCRC